MSCSCCSKGKKEKHFFLAPEDQTLSTLAPGDSAEIVDYFPGGEERYRSKLLSLGLVKGVKIRVLQVAPLGDPVEIAVLSYRLALRKEEAKILKLRKIG